MNSTLGAMRTGCAGGRARRWHAARGSEGGVGRRRTAVAGASTSKPAVDRVARGARRVALRVMTDVEPPTTELSPAEPARRVSKKRSKDNIAFAIEDDSLESTPKQQAICAASFGLCGALVLASAAHSDNPTDAALLAAGVAAGYVLSDLASGVFHWSVDNYGDGSTPVLGNVIAAFQGHHLQPWTITQRQFANNTYKICLPTIPFLVAVLAGQAVGWSHDSGSPFLGGFVGSFVAMICLSQQFHSWSHMLPREIPAAVRWFQKRNLLISCKAHGAHHKEPFEANYCIVSGLWNPLLDKSEVFRKLERVIYDWNGARPNCWIEGELHP